MDLHLLTERLYNHFYSKFYKREFKLNLELNRNAQLIQNFIDLLVRHYQLESISLNFLINYLAWSFNRRFGQITKRDISLAWIIGKSTFKKYLERKDEEAFYSDQFLAKVGINVDELRKEFIEIEQNAGLDISEENEKKRFDDDARLFHCLQFTTLYNHQSLTCLKCVNKSQCKSLLKIHYPRIFKLRGYESIKR